MKKEEAEAVLGHGDLGPIEDYLDAVAREQRLPVYAIGMCLLRMEEAAPALRAVLLRAADGKQLSDEEATLLFRGVYILGGARDTESCQPLMRLLRLPEAQLEDLLGDAVSESMPGIVAGVFDGDADALFALVADRSVDQFAREAVLDAATFLTWNGGITRDRMVRFLEKFYQDKPAEDDDAVWMGWVKAIALLGLRVLAPLVHRAWDEGHVPDWGVIDRNEFEDILVEAERKPAEAARFEEFHIGYIEDVPDALAWTDRPDVEEDDELSAEELFDDSELDAPWTPTEPVRNPWRNVGRNDPCPCGSGKKAKKCCLARSQGE